MFFPQKLCGQKGHRITGMRLVQFTRVTIFQTSEGVYHRLRWFTGHAVRNFEPHLQAYYLGFPPLHPSCVYHHKTSPPP